ncbi:heavy metal translocating P-type ATPase [Pontibacter sp. 13R65]|uniref:heavy metal translocating P-type ATPase n=1 Tax=Pontibacter sp. 13R65 TaxID=3127458 RepID=UPI00301C9880
MEAALQTNIQTCYHCGDSCNDEPIVAHDKTFCCDGCKTVYQLLEENNLCTYYNLEQSPGISGKQPLAESRFAYLDDAGVEAQLVNFRSDTISKLTFYVPQMHCSSCIWLLENLFKLNPGISESTVNFIRKELSLTYYNQQTTLREVVQLLARIGYEPAITLADTDGKKTTRYSRTIIYRLGIAGFCFGNVMLLAFPDYLAVTNSLQRSFGSFFGYLSLLLSIPTWLYSARGFFTSAIEGIKQRMVNIDLPIATGLLALFFVSVYQVLTGSGPGYLDSFTGLVFFMLIGKYFQQKTYDTLSFDRDYTSYFPVSITVLKDDQEEEYIPVRNLKVGRRIRIRNQELIPADAILLRGTAMIDYSFVSGESEPVEKVTGEIIYAGGRQVGESVELEVVKEVSQGYLTQLWNDSVFSKQEQAQSVGTYANAAGKWFIIGILIVAAGTLTYWVPRDLTMAMNAFISVLIIACPCALSLATPFVHGHTLRVFGKNKFYLRNTAVVETLAKIDTVVFDKTGTLTEPSAAEVTYNGKDLDQKQQRYVKSILSHSTHPLSQRIFQSMAGETSTVQSFQEFAGKGLVGEVDGKLVRVGSAAYLGVNTLKGQDTMQTAVYVSVDGVLLGYYTFFNVYRDGLADILQGLEDKNISVLSGDNDHELVRLRGLLGEKASLNFNQSPMQKLEYIQQLKDEQHRVLMVGDGLNDAGALKQSDAGIALTNSITNFSPSCDAILDATAFHKLSKFLAFSRKTMNIILATFAVSLVYNVIGLTLAVQGLFTPIASAIIMPISSLSVIIFATLSVKIAAKRAGL